MLRLLLSGLGLFVLMVGYSAELPKVVNYSMENNPSFNQTWSIAQSNDGFLYYATSGGLLEFDGTYWNKYIMPNRQILRSVAVDQEQRIFVGGFEEFGYWATDIIDGLKYHSLVELVPYEELAKEQIWNIIIEGKTIYFQSFSRIFKYANNQIEIIYPPRNFMFGRIIHEELLFPIIGMGLSRFEKGNTFSNIAGSDFFADKSVECLVEHSSNAFLVGTKRAGVFIKKNQSFYEWNTTLNQKLIEFQLNKGIRLSDGSFAIGTVLNGVFIVDEDGNIRYHINKENGLQNNTVLGLLEDRAGNLWVCTDYGIDLIMKNDPLIFYQDRYGKLGTVYAAVEYDDKLFLGTNQGVFCRESENNNSGFDLVEGTQGQVWDLEVIGQQLICGHNRGTFTIDKNRIQQISSVTGGYDMIPIPGQENKFIQGTYTGLVLFELDQAQKLIFIKRLTGFSESSKYLVFDEHEHLWVAHPNRGLFRLGLSKDFKRVESFLEFGQKDGLPTPYNLSVSKLIGKITIKAGNEYFYYNQNNKSFLPLKDSLFYPVQETFIVEKGIEEDYLKIYDSRIEWIKEGQTINLNVALVPDNPYLLPLENGQFLFCMQNGYAILDPNRLKEREDFTGNIFIRKVQSNQLRFNLNGSNQLIGFPAREKNLEFFYTSTNFGKRKEYSYLLEGFMKEWSSYETVAQKSFTNLPGGNYTFKVRTKNAPNQVATVDFSIAFKWYETKWAKFLFALGVIGIFYAAYLWHKFRLFQIQKTKEKQLEEERIKSRNEKLQMEVINKSKDLANSTMNLIRKNELLLKMKEKLKDLKKENGHIQYAKSYEGLVQLVDRNMSTEKDLELFDESFEQVHEGLYKKLKQQYPDLTPGDLRLAAYLKMNFSSKEIAPLLNISVRGVENKRYRLRKKMNLNAEVNLTEFMMSL